MSDMLERAYEVLRHVHDPELGVNIVDLGLIYDLKVEEEKAYVTMTFTSVGCPVSGQIYNDVHRMLYHAGLKDVKVEITFDPPWTPDRMTDEAKQQLGIRR